MDRNTQNKIISLTKSYFSQYPPLEVDIDITSEDDDYNLYIELDGDQIVDAFSVPDDEPYSEETVSSFDSWFLKFGGLKIRLEKDIEQLGYSLNYSDSYFNNSDNLYLILSGFPMYQYKSVKLQDPDSYRSLAFSVNQTAQIAKKVVYNEETMRYRILEYWKYWQEGKFPEFFEKVRAKLGTHWADSSLTNKELADTFLYMKEIIGDYV